MRTAGMLLSLVVVLAIGYYYYTVQVTPGPATHVSPGELIDVVGVKNDLVAIGQSERLFLAANGSLSNPTAPKVSRLRLRRLIHRSGIGPLFRLMKPCSSLSARRWHRLSSF
jgi:hypothetical protein